MKYDITAQQSNGIYNLLCGANLSASCWFIKAKALPKIKDLLWFTHPQVVPKPVWVSLFYGTQKLSRMFMLKQAYHNQELSCFNWTRIHHQILIKLIHMMHALFQVFGFFDSENLPFAIALKVCRVWLRDFDIIDQTCHNMSSYFSGPWQC